jgi:hypothetical protein
MNEGSSMGNLALARLAAGLGLSPVALKVALEEAFDIMQHNGNAGLSLHMALARLGYQINGQVLYAGLGVLRSNFACTFDGTQGKGFQNRPFEH